MDGVGKTCSPSMPRGVAPGAGHCAIRPGRSQTLRLAHGRTLGATPAHRTQKTFL